MSASTRPYLHLLPALLQILNTQLSSYVCAGEDKIDDYVHTGQTWTYTWYVTERTSPGPADGSSVVWMYHSHSHEIQDSYAGLMGAIVVTRRVCN